MHLKSPSTDLLRLHTPHLGNSSDCSQNVEIQLGKDVAGCFVGWEGLAARLPVMFDRSQLYKLHLVGQHASPEEDADMLRLAHQQQRTLSFSFMLQLPGL